MTEHQTVIMKTALMSEHQMAGWVKALADNPDDPSLSFHRMEGKSQLPAGLPLTYTQCTTASRGPCANTRDKQM